MTITVRIRAARDGAAVIRVEDDDPGIASEMASAFPAVRHHQASWHGVGAGDRSPDRRSARRDDPGRPQPAGGAGLDADRETTTAESADFADYAGSRGNDGQSMPGR